MIGPIWIAVAVVLALPPVFLIMGMLFSAVLGWALVDDAEERYEGSELIDLNE